MKKKNIKLLTLALATLLVSSCTSGQENSSTTETSSSSLPHTTGIHLVENGESNYRIVYEAGADANVMAAVSELQFYLSESSGCATIEASQEDSEEFDVTKRIISIGDTSIFKGSGLTITSEMKKTGYYLKRFGNTLIINALDGNGIVDGVYDMLHDTIGLEFYADDEVSFDKKETIDLLDFDETFYPFIDVRDILMKRLSKNYRRRLRLFAGTGTGQWVTFAHTNVSQYLPYDTYGVEHPDWYNSTKTQVCYANEEMRHEMARVIESKLANNVGGQYVMVGHEDNWDMCDCEECAKEMELYGGYAGQELHYTNELSKEVDAWLADNQPGRRIDYVFFAYQTSQNPPVKTKMVDGKSEAVFDEDGRYVPCYDEFNIRDNVNVIYCPIDADFSLGFSSTENAAQYEQLKGWSDIFHKSGRYNNLLIWSYSLAVRSYFSPFNNFGACKEQYRAFRDLGAIYLMDQANHSSGIPCFESLKLYAQSKMMYREDYDYNEIVDDFINHYYGPAAETFKEYFNFYRTHYMYNNISGSVWQNLENTSLWPIEAVNKLISYLDQCLLEIEVIKESDPARYEVLNDRLRKERLTPIYYFFKFYMSYLTEEQKEEYLEDMIVYTTKNDITETAESQHNMETLIQEWTNSIRG